MNRWPADPGLWCFSQQLCPNMWGKYLSVYLQQEIVRILIFQRNIDDVFFPGSTKVSINLTHSAKRSNGIFSQIFVVSARASLIVVLKYGLMCRYWIISMTQERGTCFVFSKMTNRTSVHCIFTILFKDYCNG